MCPVRPYVSIFQRNERINTVERENDNLKSPDNTLAYDIVLSTKSHIT